MLRFLRGLSWTELAPTNGRTLHSTHHPYLLTAKRRPYHISVVIGSTGSWKCCFAQSLICRRVFLHRTSCRRPHRSRWTRPRQRTTYINREKNVTPDVNVRQSLFSTFDSLPSRHLSPVDARVGKAPFLFALLKVPQGHLGRTSWNEGVALRTSGPVLFVSCRSFVPTTSHLVHLHGSDASSG